MVLLLALLLTALSYAASLRFEFVFDDQPQIVENQQLRSWSSAPGFFTHHLWAQLAPEGMGNFYRPLFLLWLLLNFKMFGLHAAGWHAATVAVHVLATWLVFRLALRLTADEWIAAATALLFGLHPTHIETAAWISGVTDPLMAVFFVGAFLRYLRWHAGEEGARNLTLATVLAFLALLAKETAIVLPGLVAAHAWLYRRGGWSRQGARATFAAAAPFVALDALYLAIRVGVLHGIAHHITELPLRTALLTVPSLLWFYVRHLVWPVGLSAFYDTPYVETMSVHEFFLPMAGVAAAVLLVVLGWRRARAPAVALAALWTAIPLLPVLDVRVFQMGELAHDRYLYLPCIGFSLLLAYAVFRLPAGKAMLYNQPAGRMAALAALALCFGAATAWQSLQWANTISLYAHAAQVAPHNIHAIKPLAIELVRRQRFDDALPVLERATRLLPSDWTNHFLLGFANYRVHRYADAERALLGAIPLEPNNAGQYYFLGLARLEAGEPQRAEEPLRHAIALLPQGHGFHQALARVLLARGDVAGARAELETELRLDPSDTNVRAELERIR